MNMIRTYWKPVAVGLCAGLLIVFVAKRWTDDLVYRIRTDADPVRFCACEPKP